MQVAAVSLNVPMPIKCMKSFEPNKRSTKMPRTIAAPRAVATTASETFAIIDYNSPISVFPMEACDLLGGDICAARMFSETKLAASTDSNRSRTNSQEIDRDYLAYDEPKTVFPGEACDNLGGEFCEAIYQQGVQQDLVLA